MSPWTEADFQKVFSRIDSLERDMVEMQKQLSAIPAISPESGGDGEEKKAAYLYQMVQSLSPDELETVKAPDARVSCGYRPSIIARWRGSGGGKTIWIMTHVDVVPPGPLELWEASPYEVVERDGKLIGRGVEDNQQNLVASFFAVKAILDSGLRPILDAGLMLVADEEVGSTYGAHYLIGGDVPGFVSPGDMIIVPDGGAADGSKIEVAEKTILWIRCKIKGRQSHGSRPDLGNNAHRAGAKLLLAMDERLHAAYAETDDLFEPPESTFEPTKKDANVENVNTVPGEDVFYFDCRILPGPPVEEVMALVREVADGIERDLGVEISFETPQRQQAAPATPVDSEVVTRLSEAIRATRGIEARPIGIGGGTVAAIFREAGFDAAVWATLDETAHQPNEYCRIKNMIADAKVFAHILGNP